VPKVTPAARRQLTLLIAVAGIAAAVLAAALIPVPYVILSPGPTLNTLGAKPSGKNLIQISGHRTYPTDGHLNLVTVSYQGGPAAPLNLFAALQGWLSPHEAVVPQEELFPANQTQQQVTRQDTQQMVGSQQLAQAAALCQLGIKFETVDTVNFVEPGMPAAGVLHKGDVIRAVDGKPVTCKTPVGTLIKARPPGSTVALTVDRNGAIAANGAVSPIGGIQQKMAGARAAGATIFLTPAGNCPDTAGAVPQGLRLIKVSTLAGAVHELKALAAGDSVPSC